MAITWSDEFTKRAEVNSGDLIAVVHLFYSESAYLALSTTAVEIGTVQHVGCVKDDGMFGTTWKIGTDNLVTLTAPTITLMEYSTPDGYSLISDMNTKGILGGQRITVHLGYAGTALIKYAKIFDGHIDEPKFNGTEIILECMTEEPPDTVISGSKIDYKAGKFGERDVDALSVYINEKADGMIIPVVFGYHWNAPGLCYEIASEKLSFVFDDSSWGSTYRKDASLAGLRQLYRHNLNRTAYRALLVQEDRLVPAFDRSTNNGLLNGKHLLFETDAGDFEDTRLEIDGVSWPRYFVSSPVDCWQVMYDGDARQFFVDIPLRPRIASTESPEFIADCEIAEGGGSFTDLFDGDAANDLILICDKTGERYGQINTYIRLWEQLAHDAKCIPRKNRLISLAADPSGAADADTYTTLILGRFKLTAGDGTGRSVMLWLLSAPGYTSETRLGHSTDYNYFSQLIQQGSDGTWNAFDPTADTITGWSNYTSGVGNGGNYNAEESEGQLPYLGRSYFEKNEALRVRAGFINTDNTPMSGTFYDIALHNMRPVPVPIDDFIFTDYIGFTWEDCNPTLLSRPSGQDNNYTCVIPPQYIETILRVKNETDFNTAEWTAAHARFNLYFSTHRDESGFCLHDEIKLKDFLKDYLKYEPFTVFIDTDGTWRLRYIHQTLADIVAQETIHTIEYTDLEGNIEFGLTPKEWLCTEIKSCESDRIYGLDDYAEKHHWKLADADYDYDLWDSKNSYSKNRYYTERMELKYTSSCVADYVSYDGKYYGCLLTNSGQAPDTAGSVYWTLLSGENSTDWGGSPSAWDTDVVYRGSDAENRAIAEYWVNQWANRHRTVRVSTLKKDYLKLEVGDYVQFANIPDTLLGMTIKGFAGNEDTETVAVNGQNALYCFIITGIRKSMNKVTMDCMQCHDLATYRVREGERGNDFA